MDRVFLDANVLFSAAYSETSGLTRLWKLRGVELVTSGYALGETLRNVETVQHRSETVQHRSRLARLMIDVTVVPEPATIPPECGRLADKDQPILAAAIAARATHLLTGDLTHFGRFWGKTIGEVLILRPSEYLGAKQRKRE